MTDLTIRPATPSDAEAVRTLTRLAYQKWVDVIHREPAPMQANYHLAIQNHKIELMESGDKLVGLIELIPQDDYLLIENLAVHPDHQGFGIGDRLLIHCEGLAANWGFKQLQLYTHAAFEQNLGFYAKRGFQEFKRTSIATGGKAVYMKKEIEIAPIACEHYDQLELLCLYQFQIRATLKTGSYKNGQAIGLELDANRREQLVIAKGDGNQAIAIADIERIDVQTPNPHIDSLTFSKRNA